MVEQKQLAGEIQQAVKSRSYSGLEDKLNRFLELKPDDPQAIKLLQKLHQRQARKKSQDEKVLDISSDMEEESSSIKRKISGDDSIKQSASPVAVWLKVGGVAAVAMLV